MHLFQSPYKLFQSRDDHECIGNKSLTGEHFLCMLETTGFLKSPASFRWTLHLPPPRKL